MTRFSTLLALIYQFVTDFWRLILGQQRDIQVPDKPKRGQTDGDAWLEAARRQALENGDKAIYVTADQVAKLYTSPSIAVPYQIPPSSHDPTVLGSYRGFEVRLKGGDQ